MQVFGGQSSASQYLGQSWLPQTQTGALHASTHLLQSSAMQIIQSIIPQSEHKQIKQVKFRQFDFMTLQVDKPHSVSHKSPFSQSCPKKQRSHTSHISQYTA
jgi:hypothetical protein